ncbi:hypothetical protein ATI61_105683 [Archangium gephyra]|uniref:Lipoprotein n=1 Tax=Archangium gephyra TaxID=48 RepID=A0AAC8THH2_9BACT|nr:hypothetical protein [Archangium gephyra]AKJ06327.1 Hypothetical protein AA314_07953 [Archangium gephyra]REG32355.1 hypothetical protein ATI61_105683 [Archangium gephyra]
MSPMPWRSAVVPLVLFLSGCAGDVSGALLNTGVALGASAISRSQGGCYAVCPVGTTCNESTGYCDPLPCRGECAPFEECVEEKLVYQCIARNTPRGNIIVNPPEPRSSEPRSSEPGTDVPRASKLRTDVPRLTPESSSEERTAEPTP